MAVKRTKKLENIADQIESDEFQKKWENGVFCKTPENAQSLAVTI